MIFRCGRIHHELIQGQVERLLDLQGEADSPQFQRQRMEQLGVENHIAAAEVEHFEPITVGRFQQGLSVIDGGKMEDERQVLEAVDAAFRLGGDVNAVNQAGDAALHGAASLGYNTVVQFLADHGANLNLKNKAGATALRTIAGRRGEGANAADRAANSPRQSTADLLRKLGATQ